MGDFQICQCGTMPGYPHAADCPFPYFAHNEDRIAEWLAAREKLIGELMAIRKVQVQLSQVREGELITYETLEADYDPQTDDLILDNLSVDVQPGDFLSFRLLDGSDTLILMEMGGSDEVSV